MPTEMTLDEIEQKLAYLGKASKRIAQAAVLAGAKVMAASQASLAKVGTSGRRLNGKAIIPGGMKRSIKARSMKATAGVAGAKSGLDVGRRPKDADPETGARGHHGHLFVGGTVRRETGSVRVRIGRKTVGRKPTGNPVMNRGIMPSSHPSFIKTGAAAAESQVVTTMHATLSRLIGRAMERLGE